MNDTNIDVQNGYNQIAPNATNQIQNFYGFDFAEKLLKTKECPLTLVVLGAGVDATLGLPTSSSLVPRIVEYLESDEVRLLMRHFARQSATCAFISINS